MSAAATAICCGRSGAGRAHATLACDQQCRWTQVQTQTLKNRLARSTTSHNVTLAKASELLSKGDAPVRDADIFVVPIEGVDLNYRAYIVAETEAAGAVRHCEK